MREFKPSYTGPRKDVLRLVPPAARRVLDVGCGTGALGEEIKKRGDVEVVGIELDERMAAEAGSRLDGVIVADVEEGGLEKRLEPSSFDCIVFADVLEHLKDPWGVLKRMTVFMRDGGLIVASLPNVRHFTTVRSLVLGGRWPYRERGVHDRTHLRFFTLKNIRDMFGDAGLAILRVERNYRVLERFHPLNRCSKYFALPFLKDFLTYQYLVVAGKERR